MPESGSRTLAQSDDARTESPPIGAFASRRGRRRPEDAEADRRLMEAVRAGDRRAIADLYDRNAAAMLGLALRILRDRSDAEDLIHDVFLEAWKRSTSYSPPQASVRSWLLMRVRSRAIDRLRSLDVARRHARKERVARQDAPAATRADDASTAHDARRARAALAALPEPLRVVLELAYFEGLSCAEIAQRCDTPLGTVKSRLLAGMRSLRNQFDGCEGGA